MTMKNSSKKDENSFNGLTPTEWASLSKNVWDDVSSPREAYHLEHGATYPIALADRIIKMYSKEGDLVFDPFVGVGTTVTSAYRQNRSGVGIELSENFCKIANNVLNKEKANLFHDEKGDLFHIIYNDDCRNLKKYLKDNTVQLTFTSPPYANFIQKSLRDREETHKKSLIKYSNNSTVKQYSQKTEDFGNLDYQNFLKEIKKILTDNLQVTKGKGYSVWVVKDYRDTKNKIPYIDFHSDLASIGKEIGWLYQDLIIWDQNGQRRLVLLGYPSVFYTNQNCSFIIVFRKP
ncbi:MAG TPA: DNA methyltransferase [Patescibacteria group bacterium]|nr:DNA methyltransferase [Patescibacteria group bacterium]